MGRRRLRSIPVNRWGRGARAARRRGELNSGATGRSGSPWWLLYGGGWSAGGDKSGGGGQRSLAAGCWGGKAFGVRAVLGVVQMWLEEDRCGLASRTLLAVVAQLR
jgi:hypothetical protein